MSSFWWIVIIIAIIWFFMSQRSKDNAVKAYSTADEANSWFLSEGIDPKSVMFSAYTDPDLLVIQDTTLLIGVGKDSIGKVGFAIEVKRGFGVVQSHVFENPNTASHHRMVTQKAKAMGMPLIEMAPSLE
jgi:hypothetical protein